MPRVNAKASSPSAKHARRPVPADSKVHTTSPPSPVQSRSMQTPVDHLEAHGQLHQEQSKIVEPQLAKKRVIRRPKYHETTTFLERESFKGLAPTDGVLPPGKNAAWFPSTKIGESYRVAATIYRAARQSSLETRPVSWGYGHTDGTLGHNNTRRVVEIKRMTAFRHAIVRAVSAGDRLSLFLTDDNRIFQAGRLFMKQDGCAMWKPVEIKIESGELPSSSPKFAAVEAGHLAAYALDDQGRLYSWGSQIFGQLGQGEELHVVEDSSGSKGPDEASADGKEDGDVDDKQKGVEEEGEKDEHEKDDGGPPPLKIVIVEKVPKHVETLAEHPIMKVSAGNHFAVAISTNGAVFSWGRGCFGQLGNGGYADVSTPARVEALTNYVAIDIAAGMNHVLGVFVARQLLSEFNQLRVHGSMSSEDTSPTQHSIVLAWGRGQYGCLGFGGSKNEPLPCENSFFRGLGAIKVAAGAGHSLVLCGVGALTFLYAYGDNRLGQLGVASHADHVDMPTFVDEFVNVHIAAIGAGAQYSAALTGDGEVFSWGDARYGKTCRADGRTTYVPWKIDLPTNIPTKSFITQLSVGMHHTLAQLRISGEVDRWRKFPLGGIVPATCYQEGNGKVSICKCKGSQTTTRSVLGIFVQCETCRMSPLCRMCCRRCHVGHALVPVAIGRGLRQYCACSEGVSSAEVSCSFASKLPPAIPEEMSLR